VVRRSGLSLRTIFLASFVSLILSGGTVVLLFTWMILGLDNPFDARYFIAIGGMLLGNSLRGNVVAVSGFFNGVRRDEATHLYRLSVGATRLEALLPNLRASVESALAPTIAAMSTMGIVALPGMMTGQVLGGSSPLVAVKYQIAIMLAILSTVALSVALALLLGIPLAFDSRGILRRSAFARKAAG
jgi:putative ABC transport system permease protein